MTGAPATAPLVVMKFGGTSVADGDAIDRVVNIVRRERGRGSTAVVVVSAMSGVTDRLLSLAVAAATGDRAGPLSGLDDVRSRHVKAATALLSSRSRDRIIGAIDADIEELRAVLMAVSILREASPRSRDGITAAGELMSSRLVAAALAERDVPACWVDARRVVITDDTHTAALPLPDEIRAAALCEIGPHAARRTVVVLGGYIGATRGGITTTLGRGGSDYSAALIGASLDCSEIQIWTDVDGMLTADPGIVPAPRVVAQLSFGEASELAYFGAKVLHPSTILPAIERNIRVRILNSRRPDGPGTLIAADAVQGREGFAAIACKRPITLVDVTTSRMLMAHGFLRRLFEVFERYRTPVDVVTTSEVSVSITVDDDRQLDSILAALRDLGEVAVDRDMALLCVVGDRLRVDPAMAVRILASLEGFSLRMVSQAASRRNITVVLDAGDAASAMKRLHETWFEGGAPAAEQEASVPA